MNTYITTAIVHVRNPNHPLYKTPINGIQAKILITKYDENSWEASAVEPGGFVGMGDSLDECLLQWENTLKLSIKDILIDAKKLGLDPLDGVENFWRDVNKDELDLWWVSEVCDTRINVVLLA